MRYQCRYRKAGILADQRLQGKPWPAARALVVFLRAVFLVACFLNLTEPAMGQAGGVFQLAGVKVNGSVRYKESEIVHATGLNLAASITLDALQEAARKLGSLGVFTEVSYRYQTQGNNLTAEFTVKDAGKPLPCVFENFVWFSREELLSGLRSRVPLFEGSVPPGGGMLEMVSSGLEGMLAERGVHAQVQAAPSGELGGPVRSMGFKVVGVSIPIRRIEFTGVQKVDPASLVEAAHPLIDKDFDASFVRDFSNGGVAQVYHRQGYLRARFGEPVPHLVAGETSRALVEVTLAVTEGEQYRLKEIRWSGESAISYLELATKSIHLAPGEPVNALELEQDVLALPMLFHRKGYLDADVRSKTALDDSTQTATYELEVRQGDLYRLGKLEITGLDDARAASLARLSRQQPGDPYEDIYWDRFLEESLNRLPSNVFWKAKAEDSIHRETKTVDVRITFTAGVTR